jgi:hypothetical protein
MILLFETNEQIAHKKTHTHQNLFQVRKWIHIKKIETLKFQIFPVFIFNKKDRSANNIIVFLIFLSDFAKYCGNF